jgi:hypothetical protein
MAKTAVNEEQAIHQDLLKLEGVKRQAHLRWENGTMTGSDYRILEHYISDMWQRYYQLQQDIKNAIDEFCQQTQGNE